MGSDNFTVTITGHGKKAARLALLADLERIADDHREIIVYFGIQVPPTQGESVEIRQPTAAELAELEREARPEKEN